VEDFSPSTTATTTTNAFDMRRLEQEISAIQKGELPISDSYTILSNEVSRVCRI
jgi:hypothetical protein